MIKNLMMQAFGCLLLTSGYIYWQISRQSQGIIDRGFDAALSIGLLIIGIIVLGWYHRSYQKHSREVIEKLADDKDKKSEKIAKIVEKQTELSEKQIASNEHLADAVDRLTNRINEVA